jgi:hypothetical protein
MIYYCPVHQCRRDPLFAYFLSFFRLSINVFIILLIFIQNHLLRNSTIRRSIGWMSHLIQMVMLIRILNVFSGVCVAQSWLYMCSVLKIIACPFVIFFYAIVLSVLPLTASAYPFCIFTFFLNESNCNCAF